MVVAENVKMTMSGRFERAGPAVRTAAHAVPGNRHTSKAAGRDHLQPSI